MGVKSHLGWPVVVVAVLKQIKRKYVRLGSDSVVGVLYRGSTTFTIAFDYFLGLPISTWLKNRVKNDGNIFEFPAHLLIFWMRKSCVRENSRLLSFTTPFCSRFLCPLLFETKNMPMYVKCLTFKRALDFRISFPKK